MDHNTLDFANTAPDLGPKIDYVLVKTSINILLPSNVVLAKKLVGKQFGRIFCRVKMKLILKILRRR
jgi:hypothetical protein